MNPVEKLALLRAEMAKRHIDAYVVVTDDFHTSEYVGAHFKARELLSGFTDVYKRQVLGLKRSAQALTKNTPSHSNASAVRRMVPTCPGSCTPSSTR